MSCICVIVVVVLQIISLHLFEIVKGFYGYIWSWKGIYVAHMWKIYICQIRSSLPTINYAAGIQ